MSVDPLIEETPAGLFCRRGGFHIDPWAKVDKAVITHAHADHARSGSAAYLASHEGRRILRSRLGPSAVIETLKYGEMTSLNGVHISLHPAGHILGSAQVRVEYRGEVWVISGDYKTEPDPTCTPFEPVRCHTFITESTFGLPIYRWPAQQAVFADINQWWMHCRDADIPAVIFAYSLGKAQRLIAGVNAAVGPIFCHSSVEELNAAYRASGITLPPTFLVSQAPARKKWGGVLLICPPGAADSAWMNRFSAASTAMASGWMLTRATRRWQSVDRGFPLSDHADWPGLLSAIEQTGAEQILVTHGHTEPMVRYLQEQGKQARTVVTRFSPQNQSDTALTTESANPDTARQP